MKNPLKIILKSPKKALTSKEASSLLTPSNIITTPCEKVLEIILEAKTFIQNNTKGQFALIANLEWAIEIISSRSLYSYEIKEKEKVNKLSEENPEFKQLVEFVSEYNEKVISMSRKYNSILTDKLLLKPSINLNKKKIKRKSSFNNEQTNLLNILEKDEQNNNTDNTDKNDNNNIDNINSARSNKEQKNFNIKNNTNNNTEITTTNTKNEINKIIVPKKKISTGIKKKNQQVININDKEEKEKSKEKNKNNTNNNPFIKKGFDFLKGYFNPNISETRKKSHDKKSKNKFIFFPSVQKISITINNNNNSNKLNNNKRLNTEGSREKRKKTKISMNRRLTANPIKLEELQFKLKKNVIKKPSVTVKSIPHISKNHFPFISIQNRLIQEGYDISRIINEKNFDIFLLRDIIGYNNVLPFVGRIILENLGLIDEEILSVQKLDPFLIAVNNQYKPEVLYHNCLHGSDVTQSCYIFFTYSNAEKIAQTNVLDLLSIFIAALGHDIAHPGLTNNFHINDSTDIAITYNDISVLENFHASTLFKTIRKSETNIFENLSLIDYKIIRKRIVSEILATDMALHGKVISLIKSKMVFNEDDKTYRLNLLSGDDRTRSDEQQSLLDFMIHLADLAHNTRLFNISIKWVELLSEEFWRQGDLEKEHNLPVSFLCDRENVNIPQSQKGFLSGFILSTYECLGNIFPSLKFTYDNAQNNLKEWQKLLNEGRVKGWTPKKDDKNNENKIKLKLKRALTKNYEKENFLFLKGKINNNNDVNENKDSFDEKNNEEEKEEKIPIINSVKNKKNLNINMLTITEKNNGTKRNLYNQVNPFNTDINKKNNIKTPSKLKLSINDNFPSTENKNNSEFKLLNSKKEKVNVENKMYKNNDKVVCKKNANKKKNCK